MSYRLPAWVRKKEWLACPAAHRVNQTLIILIYMGQTNLPGIGEMALRGIPDPFRPPVWMDMAQFDKTVRYPNRRLSAARNLSARAALLQAREDRAHRKAVEAKALCIHEWADAPPEIKTKACKICGYVEGTGAHW